MKNQLIGTGELEKPVGTEPLDELTVGIGWASERPSSCLNSKSVNVENEDQYEIHLQIYLDGKGTKIVNSLSKYREFSEDLEDAIGRVQYALALIGVSITLPNNKISNILLVLSLMTLPFTRLEIEGKIRASPILRVKCLECGLHSQFNPDYKEDYNQLKHKCPQCEAENEKLKTFLIK